MTWVMATGTLVFIVRAISITAEVHPPAWAGQSTDALACVVDQGCSKLLPNDWLLGTIVTVTGDARNHIRVLHHPDTLSDFRTHLGDRPRRAGCFHNAHTVTGLRSVKDIGFLPDDNEPWLYVADGTDARIRILRRDGLPVVGSFGRHGHFGGGFTMVHSIVVDSKGNLDVGETVEVKRF